MQDSGFNQSRRDHGDFVFSRRNIRKQLLSKSPQSGSSYYWVPLASPPFICRTGNTRQMKVHRLLDSDQGSQHVGQLTSKQKCKINKEKSCGLISLLCYIKKFQVTESSSVNRTKNIAQQYFYLLQRTPQEVIPEGFFMLGLVLPRVAVTAATLAFSRART